MKLSESLDRDIWQSASDLWETVYMADEKFKVGQLVVPDGLVGVYRIMKINPGRQTADIEKFDISAQKSVGDPSRPVALNKLTAYKEDESQAAARIAREAITED